MDSKKVNRALEDAEKLASELEERSVLNPL